MTQTAIPNGRSTDHRTVLGAPELLDQFNQADVLDPVDVHSATVVGELYGEADPAVLLAAALTVRGTRFGHVCVDLRTVRESVAIEGIPAETVDALPWPEPDTWLADVTESPLTGDGSSDRPLVVDGPLLYLERYWDYETAVAANLTTRMALEPVHANSLNEPLRRFFAEGAGLQRLAAAMGATGRLTVIGGGPGTGKTYTIARLLGVLFEHAHGAAQPPPVLAVAAPTGKAAARLTEQIRAFGSHPDTPDSIRDQVASVKASTLHRLLGWHPQRGRFRHGAGDPLPHDTVIVDEMSMVSLPMTAKLLDAVHPEARAILVGDPNQLVSIEAGTVLGDLIGPAADGLRFSEVASKRLSRVTGEAVPSPAQREGMGDHVVMLDRGFRFESDSSVAQLADAVRSGDADGAVSILRGEAERIRWFDTEARPIEEMEEVMGLVVGHADRLVDLGTAGDAENALAQVEQLALLCAHRRGEFGVGHWAPWVERHSRAGTLQWEGGRWYAGRPTMVTTNDYNLGVFNGDIGVTVRDGDRLAVAFETADGVRLIGPAQLPSSEAVHAMTIHKSQGSQFEKVIVLVPPEESRLLTRELLYTAVTRAKSEVFIIGSEAAIRAAVDRRVARASGLRRRLWEPTDH